VKRRLPGTLVALACLLLLAHEPRAEQPSSIRDVTAAIAQGAEVATGTLAIERLLRLMDSGS
jgi:hypothetical protein